MNKNCYVIENKNVRTNYLGEMTFRTIEEAKSWTDCIEEDIANYNADSDKDEQLRKDDFIISYYDTKGTQRGDWPLFE